MNLRDLAALYQSQSIEDRRGDSYYGQPQPVRFGPTSLASPMEHRLPAAQGSLAALAGFNDIPDDFDERLSAAADAFSQVDRRTPTQEFQSALGTQEVLSNLMNGNFSSSRSPLLRRR